MKRILTVGLNILALLCSAAFMVAAWKHKLPSDLSSTPIEAFAVVTGAWNVWYVVKEHIWNWAIGIVSCGCYVIVFYQGHLYGDMGLQVVYIVLGLLGWYWWLYGGQKNAPLYVVRADRLTLLVTGGLIVLGTAGMTIFLQRIHDAAPFLDAFTTVASLGAQYLMMRKMIENWYGWLAVDVIYVYLYEIKHLPNTAILYAGFIVMCILGLVGWHKTLKSQNSIGEASQEPLPTDVWPPPPRLS